eukprot:3435135-Rhodomonas_salina.2
MEIPLEALQLMEGTHAMPATFKFLLCFEDAILFHSASEPTGEDDSKQLVHCIAQLNGQLVVEQFSWLLFRHQCNLNVLPGCREDTCGEGLIDDGPHEVQNWAGKESDHFVQDPIRARSLPKLKSTDNVEEVIFRNRVMEATIVVRPDGIVAHEDFSR